MMVVNELAKESARKWRADPISFFTEVLGVKQEHVWHKMREISESVRDYKYTAVKAGHGVSKSYTAARTALWYLYTHYPSTVITTAPTFTQVEQILWREMREAKANALFELPGKMTATRLDLQSEDATARWFAYGFATKPDQGQENATKMQGFHNEHVMVIFDEACGIIHPIWVAKDYLLTGDNCRFLAIGNPTMSHGDFVDCFSDKGYNKITISVMDTPNYQHRREVIPGLSGREFVERVKEKYGEESNQYKCRVLGEIPDGDENALIIKKWIDRAEQAGFLSHHNHEKRFITWDVADGGADLHVIKAWKNTTEIGQVVLRDKTIEEAEPHVWKLLRKIKGNTIIVDADGIGRVAVALLEQSADVMTEIIEFKGSEKPHEDDDIYFNMRAYGHWKMRCMMEAGEISISENHEQKEELLSLTLAENRRGLIQMEKKDTIRKALGRSPNHSDAIMMMCAMYDEVEPVEEYSDVYKYSYKNSGNAYRFAGRPMAT